jgi:hypothetical protein
MAMTAARGGQEQWLIRRFQEKQGRPAQSRTATIMCTCRRKGQSCSSCCKLSQQLEQGRVADEQKRRKCMSHWLRGDLRGRMLEDGDPSLELGGLSRQLAML